MYAQPTVHADNSSIMMQEQAISVKSQPPEAIPNPVQSTTIKLPMGDTLSSRMQAQGQNQSAQTGGNMITIATLQGQ